MTRNLITSGPATGADVMANLNSHIESLWNAVALPLTGIGGTANALTATLNPPLLFGLVVGMKFTLTVPAANTGGVTLVINGAAAVAVVRSDGSALTNGALSAGSRVLLEWDGAAMRVLAGASADADGGLPQRIDFTSSGTFVKADYGDFPDDHMVLVEAWGGGGGGQNVSNLSGGGGGAYMRREFRFADLPSSVTVAVGAGGAAGSAGGNSTFGALLAAYGGGAGAGGNGGGGGGSGSAGGNGAAGGGVAGRVGGGNGAATTASENTIRAGDGALWGGGGGGGATSGIGVSYPAGGHSIFGGAGGGGGSSLGGGLSIFGGNGGNAGSAGSVRGGGGGRQASGGRGEVRIWL